MPKALLFVFFTLSFFSLLAQKEKPYFQQKVNYEIHVTLDTIKIN